MAGTDTLSVLAEALAEAVSPVEIAVRSQENFSTFMLRLGWDTEVYIAPVQNLGTLASGLVQLSEGGLDADSAANAISLLVNFFEAIKGLASPTSLPATMDAGAFASDFPQQLTDYLLANYLLTRQPVLGALLLAGGVITRTVTPAAGKRVAYERLDVAWSSVGNLLGNALGTLQNAYAWGSPSFAQQSFLSNMQELGRAFGYTVFPQAVDPRLLAILDAGATSTTALNDEGIRWRVLGNDVSASPIEAGLDLFALPPTSGALPGLALSPFVKGVADTTLNLSDTLSLILKAVFDVSQGVLMTIRPGQGIALETNLFGGSPSAAGDFSATLMTVGDDGKKVVVVGSEGGSRFEYSSLSLTVGARTDKDGQSFYAEAAVADGAIVIAPGSDADGFIASLLPSDITVDASVTIGFDSRLGIYFSGSAGLELQIPTHVSIGPIDILSAIISVKPAGGAVPISLGATFRGSLGPLTAEVENIGLTVALSFLGKGGNLGPVDAALRFKPPTGVGLSVDAGVVTGGGFLSVDSDRGEYAGALQLSIAGMISVNAIGLISTKMPDGSKGFSLLIIITADFGVGIQLGFGFTLLAVGGLLGLNRAMLFQPLLDSIRTDAIESIMFPKNVVANAPRIISDLRAIFPPQEGTFLIGPMAKLGWGTPTLISLSLGVIIEIPPGDVAILGVLKLALPADDLALLILQVNFAGALEFDKKRFYFFASLFDSHVLFITLEGEMGVLFAYGDDANFVITVGGFHPQFNPPPLPFPSPTRISVDIINESFARIHCDAYFAVTTNTVQFGTHSNYFFGFSALSVEGSSGFDALIQFSPFHFIVEISTSFSVKVFGLGVYGVGIDLSLEGPARWHAHGTASLSFFFFSVDIGIDFSWGDSPNTMLPPISVMPLLEAELGKQTNWKAVLPQSSNLLVSLRKLSDAEAQFILHPVGTLQVSQRLVPLDLTLDKLGNQAPTDANRFSLTVTSASLEKSRNLQELFAPSQFQNFDDAAKLSQAAFAPQDSGIELSGAGNAFDAGTAITRTVRYDLTTIDTTFAVQRLFFVFSAFLFTRFLADSSVARSKLSAAYASKTHPFVGAVAISAETFAVAFQSDNTVYHPEAATFTSQASAHDYMTRTVAANPLLAGSLHVLPHFEVAA